MSPVLQFFLQIFAILGVCKIFSIVLAKLGQPNAVAEMMAGIFLGPSVLGLFFPTAGEFLFPKQSLGTLQVLAQFGLAFYLFLSGLEIDFTHLQKNVRSAVTVSASGILMPVLCAAGLALFSSRSSDFFSPHLTTLQMFLFLAASLSVTAFPLLARILEEKGMAQSRIGTLALMAASVDDVFCWILLSAVVATVQPQATGVLPLVLKSTAFFAAIFFFVRPLLSRFSAAFDPVLLILFVVFFCMVSEHIGMHILFGAFWLGLATPRKAVILQAAQKIKPAFTLLFLPLFFVASGLKTQINLLNSVWLWGAFGVLFALASLCKLGACYVGARMAGESHRDSFSLGALMNARGLVELVVLNVGLEAGLITPAFFAILVLVALATTWVAVPLFEWAQRKSTTQNIQSSWRVVDEG